MKRWAKGSYRLDSKSIVTKPSQRVKTPANTFPHLKQGIMPGIGHLLCTVLEENRTFSQGTYSCLITDRDAGLRKKTETSNPQTRNFT